MAIVKIVKIEMHNTLLIVRHVIKCLIKKNKVKIQKYHTFISPKAVKKFLELWSMQP